MKTNQCLSNLNTLEKAIEDRDFDLAYGTVATFLEAVEKQPGWQDTQLIRFYDLIAQMYQANGLLDVAENCCIEGLSIRPDYHSLWMRRSRINAEKSTRDFRNYWGEERRGK